MLCKSFSTTYGIRWRSSMLIKTLLLSLTAPATSSRAGTRTGTSMEVACFENASGPARIVKPLSDVQIKHGEKFKLILGVECHPPPEVIWSFQVTKFISNYNIECGSVDPGLLFIYCYGFQQSKFISIVTKATTYAVILKSIISIISQAVVFSSSTVLYAP